MDTITSIASAVVCTVVIVLICAAFGIVAMNAGSILCIPVFAAAVCSIIICGAFVYGEIDLARIVKG